MKIPRFNIGDVVTIPHGHGRESGMAGEVTAIEDNSIGRFYRVKVKMPRSDTGYSSVPVLVQVLDTLSAYPEPLPDQLAKPHK
jgi:hypothetical protein